MCRVSALSCSIVLRPRRLCRPLWMRAIGIYCSMNFKTPTLCSGALSTAGFRRIRAMRTNRACFWSAMSSSRFTVFAMPIQPCSPQRRIIWSTNLMQPCCKPSSRGATVLRWSHGSIACLSAPIVSWMISSRTAPRKWNGSGTLPAWDWLKQMSIRMMKMQLCKRMKIKRNVIGSMSLPRGLN